MYLFDLLQVESPPARRENLVALHLLKACHYPTDTAQGSFDLRFLLVLFGSVARGTAGPLSDVDSLVVADPLPRGRGARLREFEPVEQALNPDLDALRAADLARASVVKARKRMRAPEVLREEDAFSDVVREAQELVERRLKALLRSIGVDPPHRPFTSTPGTALRGSGRGSRRRWWRPGPSARGGPP